MGASARRKSAVKKAWNPHDETGGQPVVRLRSMLTGLCVLVVCLAGPLILVWKQSYINQVSMRLEAQAETLASLNRDIRALELESGRLSSPARIERIAHARGLEYPPLGRLEVLEVDASRHKLGIGAFFTRVRQSLTENRRP